VNRDISLLEGKGETIASWFSGKWSSADLEELFQPWVKQGWLEA